MNPHPTAAEQQAIVENQIRLWTNTLYEAKVQARVARVIENPQLEKAAEQQATAAIRALDELAAMLDELRESDIIGPVPAGDDPA
jgi:hypothetical protein